MGDTLTMIGLIILGLSILVTIHELGHFMTARWFGMRVEIFSLFFPPKIFGIKRGDTDYQLGAIPLGGFVKISGMIDESMDKEHLKKEPEHFEFRAKPAWQRLIVMLGGVIMNVILGILIFFVVKWISGDKMLPMTVIEDGIFVKENSVAEELKFKTGDKLITYMGDTIEFMDEVNNPRVLLTSGSYFEVEREGEMVRIDIPGDYLDSFTSKPKESQYVFEYKFKPWVLPNTKCEERSCAAHKAGMKAGDLVVSVNSENISDWEQLVEYLEKRPEEEVTVTVDRAGKSLEFSIMTDTAGHIGVIPDLESRFVTKDYNIFQAFGKGTQQAFVSVYTTIQGLGKVITGKADFSKSISGPVKIAQLYGEGFDKRGWKFFWELTGMLSMVLAFMNILPIPALDGGHVVFILIEMISGREPNPKVKIVAQQIGMVLLLLLIGYIILNDILNW